MSKKQPQLAKSDAVKQLPLACQNETAAVEFLEKQRWGDTPACVHCGSVTVYQMSDAKTGGRSKRFLWRCRDCKKQYTVRVGTVFEESRLDLRHWCYAFWRASTSKKGVAALEIQRQCQISYKAALFLLHRVRFAMAPDHATAPKLGGTVECDETYVGGKPRKGDGKVRKHGRGTSKIPVFAVVQREGGVRAVVMPVVNGANVKAMMDRCVEPSARVMTDELPLYRKAVQGFTGGHETVHHATGEYARGDIHNNSAEGFFALLKRGIVGVYHNVSREHLHRYVAEFEFRYNHRTLNDGDRTAMAIRSAEGKRLAYRPPLAD